MLEELRDLLQKGMDGVDTAENIFHAVDHANYGFKYRTSDGYRADRRKAARIDRLSFFLGWFFIILWVVILIATIVLCVTGNDAVLRFLSL